MVAIPAATMPIFQIILLILYLKLAPWIKKYYEAVNKKISEQ
jgi:ACR3 family arsenite efflux pump ArsB